jgi:hypothetical protein
MYIRMYFEVAYQLMFLGELRIAEVKAVLYNSNLGLDRWSSVPLYPETLYRIVESSRMTLYMSKI